MLKTFKLRKKSKPAKRGISHLNEKSKLTRLNNQLWTTLGKTAKDWEKADEVLIKEVKSILKKPFCLKCGSRQVYTLKDLTLVCRKCGHREKPKEEKV